MIDFLKYVNSNAVRTYLQHIHYQPIALEAAWLIWRCETISLDEKCSAWQEITNSLPDCPTNSSYTWLEQKYIDSTHAFLLAYIRLQKELASEFYKSDEPAVYEVEYQVLPSGERFWREYRSIKENFPTLETALKAIPKNKGKIIDIHVCKRNPNGGYLTIARFLPDHRLALMEPEPGFIHLNNMPKEKRSLYTDVLSYFGSRPILDEFPIPFQPGDYLYDPNFPEGDLAGGVFIYAGTTYQPRGFFLWNKKSDTLRVLDPSLLLDCEYFPSEELTEPYRIFPLVSKLLKTKKVVLDPCDLAEFIEDYHDLLLPPPAGAEKIPREVSSAEIIDFLERDEE